MNANMGTVDRALRLAVGVALIAVALFSGAGLFGAVALQYGAVAVGLVMIGTAALRFCPLYTLFGIRTCRT
jgi:hypothetical protein